MGCDISIGFEEHERDTIAAIYWQGFAQKLGFAMGPDDKAVHFIARNLNPACALVARADKGQVLGVAGFQSDAGALIGGGMRSLAQSYGWLSTLWRAPLLILLERTPEAGTLLMDGICVADHARRMGVGTALLSAVKEHARSNGLNQVRLDVIDTNPRAKALYRREGFAEFGSQSTGPLRHIFGFSSSTTLIWRAREAA